MIPWITRFGKGATIGFWVGALSILVFAIYSGVGLAGFYVGAGRGFAGTLMRFLIFVVVTGGIMLIVALAGAFAGFILEWVLRKIF